MPLDPEIILGGRPAPIQPAPSPFELAKTLSTIEDVRAQVEQRRLAADAARQKAAEDAAVRQALVATNGDLKAALPQLYQVAPARAAAIQKEWEAALKDHIEGVGKELDQRKTRLATAIQIGQMANDQNWPVVRPLMTSMSADLENVLPQDYNKQQMDSLIQSGLTTNELLTQQREAVKLYTDGKPRESFYTALASVDPTAPDATAQWNQRLKTYGALPGVPPDMIANAGEFSPENHARAVREAIGPTKEAELAQQAAVLAQTVKHQTAEEANAEMQRRIAAGQLSVSQARLQMELARPDLVQVMQDGKPVWVTKAAAIGQPAAGGAAGRPATGAERATLAFYNRGKQGIDTLTMPDATGTSLEDRVSGATTQWLGNVPIVGNYLQGADAQRYTEAQRAFTEARLRKESGAQINASEYENDRKTYFKQPGDSAAVVAQKKAARDKVLNGLAFSAGKAYEEYYGEPFTRETGTSAPSGPKVGDVVTVKGKNVRITAIHPDGTFDGNEVK